MLLLDTDVLSLVRRRERNPGLVRWLEAQKLAEVYLSVVSLGEVERGIAQQRRHNPAFAYSLTLWLESVLAWCGERILPIDLAIASRWGRLSAALGHPSVDLFIAATALEHGLAVVTRNVRHFEPTGVRVVNPFV